MVTRTWNVAGIGDWQTAANWDSGVVPTPSDLAIVLAGGNPQITSAIAVGAITDYGTIDVRNAGGSSVSTTLKIYGTFNVNAGAGSGGSTISVNGTLTTAKGGTLTLGNATPSGGFTTVGTASLVNQGTINLVGTASTPTYLNVQTAAGFGTEGVLTGQVSLTGGAVIRFASGSIKTIARTGELDLDGAGAVVAVTGGTSSNSALTGLTTNYNFMFLSNGASLALSGNFTNYGRIFSFGSTNAGGPGGGSFSAAGILTNRGGMSFGGYDQTAVTSVSAQRLVNYGELTVSGTDTAKTTVRVASSAGFGTGGTITGTVTLYGNAAIVFDSGQITRVASGANLQISGPKAVIATAAAPGTNSALALNRIDGGLALASMSITTGNLTNAGSLSVDSYQDGAAASLIVNGILKNTGSLYIGQYGYGFTNLVTVQRIDNTGRIDIGRVGTGKLVVNSAAGFGVGGKITGDVFNRGQIVFASGALYDVVAGATLSLSGTIDIAGGSGINSALTKLRSNAGTILLASSLRTTVTFTNSGAMTLTSSNVFTTTSTLINSGSLALGDDFNFTYQVRVVAARLQNSGTLTINGSDIASDSAANVVQINSAAGTGMLGRLTGTVKLAGYSKLLFASGQINAIEGTLSLDGAHAFVGLMSAPTSNSALVGLRDVRGRLDLSNAAALSLSQLDNDGITALDAASGSGGASLTVAVGIVNDGTLALGNATLSSSDHLTTSDIDNHGTISLTGNGASQARLTLGEAGFGRTGIVTGDVALHDNALIEFGSGTLTGIADGASLLLDGADAHISLTGNTGSNSALTHLTQVDGTLDLRNGANLALYDDLFIGQGNYPHYDSVYVDAPGNGGSRLDVAGDIDNFGYLQVGGGFFTPSGLTTDTYVFATHFINEDGAALYMRGLTIGNGPAAIMSIASAAGFGTDGTVSGTVNLLGNAVVLFNSPGTISEIESGATLELTTAQASLQVNTDGSINSALKGLSVNYGTLELDAGARVFTTAAFVNYGSVAMDYGFGLPTPGGGSLFSLAGRFTNEGTMNIGDREITASSTIVSSSFTNDGTINLLGNDSYSGQLNVTGTFTNNGQIIVYDGVQRFNGAVNGFGSIELDGAFVRFDAAVAATQTVIFDSFPGNDPQRITLGSAKTFAATIDGFDVGDTIDLLTFGTGSTLNYAGNAVGGVLTVTKGVNVAQLAFDGAYTNASFAIGADGTGGSLISHT